MGKLQPVRGSHQDYCLFVVRLGGVQIAAVACQLAELTQDVRTVEILIRTAHGGGAIHAPQSFVGMSGAASREQEIGGCTSPSTSTTHMRQAPKPGSLGS